jgi:transcriptional regulator with XRE-family HTH domain
LSRKTFRNSKLFFDFDHFLVDFSKLWIYNTLYKEVKKTMYKEAIARCSERIAKALSIRNMKQSELCERTKIPKSAISQYLSGAFEPKQDRLHLIANALDVSPVWLMGYDVPMEREQKNPPNEQTLTEGEQMVLELFRKIPEDRQAEALDLLRVALRMQKKL